MSFPGQGIDNAVGNFPQSWKKLPTDTPLWDVTPHVLRLSLASIANDLGFTEITIAALIGHREATRHFRASPKLVNELIKLLRETGSLKPRLQGNGGGHGNLRG